MKITSHHGSLNRQTFDDVMVKTYAPSDLVPARASGLDVWDVDGNRYLDFTSGIGVTSLGHCHVQLNDVLLAQARAGWHFGNGYTNFPVLHLAKLITASTFGDRAFFCNSGAEANEAALKLARRYAKQRFGPAKARIISCNNAFHGRTLFTVTAGGQEKYSHGYEPLPAQIDHIPFNDIKAARRAITEEVCAVIVEPIQGEGGVIPATVEFLNELRVCCDSVNALLIFDEVQTGIGRSGALFAYMNYGIVPDILTMAKALGNGFPIGGLVTKSEFAEGFSVGSHGSTFGGNPLAAAVASCVYEIISDAEFLDGVRCASACLFHKLNSLVSDYPDILCSVRGAGLMVGVVLTQSYAGRSKDFVLQAEKEGLLLLAAGPDVVRLLPALIVTEQQIEHAYGILRRVLENMV